MKARFLEPQPPVKIVQNAGMAYIFICLHEEQGNEAYPDIGDEITSQPYYEYDYNEITSQPYYEYDYNEITGPEDKLPLEEIQSNPENYLDYKYSEVKQDPGTQALAEIEEFKVAIERGLTT